MTSVPRKRRIVTPLQPYFIEPTPENPTGSPFHPSAFISEWWYMEDVEDWSPWDPEEANGDETKQLKIEHLPSHVKHSILQLKGKIGALDPVNQPNENVLFVACIDCGIRQLSEDSTVLELAHLTKKFVSINGEPDLISYYRDTIIEKSPTIPTSLGEGKPKSLTLPMSVYKSLNRLSGSSYLNMPRSRVATFCLLFTLSKQSGLTFREQAESDFNAIYRYLRIKRDTIKAICDSLLQNGASIA